LKVQSSATGPDRAAAVRASVASMGAILSQQG
jgi:hypothetical protein